jgi:hypothetical protein
MIGPESVLPVKGSAPDVALGVTAAAVTPVGVVVDVEPRAPDFAVVVVVWTVEPSVSIGVLVTVVDVGTVVDDSTVVLVVASVVVVGASVVEVGASVVEVVASVVVVVGPVEHCPPSDNENVGCSTW